MNERIKILKGDITKLQVDAIVNAANTSLLPGSGVCGAIHRAGGREVTEACEKIRREKGGCKTGEAVITTGGNLPAKYVIHTPGPVWKGGKQNEEELLSNSYRNSLKLATKYKIQSIAFPNISTGIYGFPKESAAKIAIKTCKEYLESVDHEITVYFVCFDDENERIYSLLVNSGL